MDRMNINMPVPYVAMNETHLASGLRGQKVAELSGPATQRPKQLHNFNEGMCKMNCVRVQGRPPSVHE